MTENKRAAESRRPSEGRIAEELTPRPWGCAREGCDGEAWARAELSKRMRKSFFRVHGAFPQEEHIHTHGRGRLRGLP